MKTKCIAILLALTFVFSILPLNIYAVSADEKPLFSAGEVWASSGTTVEINIDIKNNPGILGATLSVSWGEGLTLTNNQNGLAFAGMTYQAPSRYANTGTNFMWYGSDIDEIIDGTALRLTFYVDENVGESQQLPVRISCNGVYDKDQNAVEVDTADGSIRIVNYKPGDVSGNDSVDALDLIMLARYISDGCITDPEGYNTSINESAADVNDDGKMDALDLIMISRFISDNCVTDINGYNITLKPSSPKCEHNMQATASSAATCTEDGNNAYWYCTKCGKYYSDAAGRCEINLADVVLENLGHNGIEKDGVPATTTSQGFTAGVWCDRCSTWISGHEVVNPIQPNESNITYRLTYVKDTESGEIFTDSYLTQQQVDNPNDNVYVEGVGIEELAEPTVAGYKFLGWFARPEAAASRVYSVSAESTGNLLLYAVWRKEVYKITYLPDSASSTLPRVEDGQYTVDKETSLSEPPVWPNLVWVGWSNEKGEIVKSIPKGTTDDITLTANWMSKRNQTVPNTNYASSIPAIVANEEDGIYSFAYEIGDIQNVPVQQIEEGVDGKGFNLVKGMIHEISTTFTQKIGQDEATSIANTIAQATTKSDSWTLSEDWNKSTSFSQEHANEISETQFQKTTEAFSESGKYTLSSGSGGTEEHIDEKGSSTKVTKKDEFGVSVNASIKADIKADVTAGTPFKNASVSGSLGLDYKHSKETESETHETHSDSISSYWNLNEGFELSKTLSGSQENSNSLSQSIKDTYKYGETLDYGGSNSNTVSNSATSSESRQYSSAVTYSTEEGKSITVNETMTADADTGYYRKVLAANFRVFAVVIYDMESNTFSTMTYSLMIKDSEHLFTDYSTISSFNDYENGVLPFSVPTFVRDYVYGLVGSSEGVAVDTSTGIVERYGFKDPETGICYLKYDRDTDTYSEPCDTNVILPRFCVVDIDATHKKIVPIIGFSADAFRGTTVESVYLSDGITEIPERAFDNCTSLKYVQGGTIDTICRDAFKNCTSLFEFVLPDIITSLGEGAFEGVNALSVNASNTSVFDAAILSGAKRLSIDLSSFNGNLDSRKIVTPETMDYFELTGGGKIFTNLSIESAANTVSLKNITLNNTGSIPLKLSSDDLMLSFTTINSSGLAMRLDAESTNIILNGNNYISSSNNNAVLSKSMRFYETVGSSSIGKLIITGNAYVYGTASGIQSISFDSAAHGFIYLSENEYTDMVTTHYIHFDSNGGTVSAEPIPVILNSKIGILPVPTHESWTFDGWFTSDGEQVTSDTVFSYLEDITLKARWTSDWVLDNSLPDGAVASQEKWSYDLTSHTSSASSTLDGWTLSGSEITSWGAWSGWQNSQIQSTNSRQVQTRYISPVYKTQYNYSRYGADNGWSGPSKGYWGGYYCYKYTEYGWTDSRLPIDSTNQGFTIFAEYCPTFTRMWYNESTRQILVTDGYTQYSCRDGVFTYYFEKTDCLESDTKPDGTDISNVQRWVKYQIK